MAKKEKVKKFTRGQLVAAGVDMTRGIGLEPPVEVEKDDDDILASIKHEAGEIREGDKFLSETIELLRGIGIKLPAVKVRLPGEKYPDELLGDVAATGPVGPLADVDSPPAGEDQSPEEPLKQAAKAKKETATPAKTRELTRAEVFAAIFDTKPVIKERLVKEMVEKYKGSWRQAEIQIDIYLRLLVAMGLAKKVGDKYSMKEITFVKKGK